MFKKHIFKNALHFLLDSWSYHGETYILCALSKFNCYHALFCMSTSRKFVKDGLDVIPCHGQNNECVEHLAICIDRVSRKVNVIIKNRHSLAKGHDVDISGTVILHCLVICSFARRYCFHVVHYDRRCVGRGKP
eukprot:6195964-Pleurochrysis_carterae.AAC.2